MKKAIVSKTLVEILLGLIGFIILALFLMAVLFPLILNVSEAWACRWSSLIKYGTIGRIPFTGIKVFESSAKLHCPEQKIIINKKDKNEVIEKVADAMATCWWKVWEGKLDFYGDIDIGKSDTRCLICATIKAKDSSYNTKINIDEYQNYLNSKKPRWSNLKYSEYLSGQKNVNLNFVYEGEPKPIEITDNFNQYVVYVANKKGRTFEAFGVEPTIAAATGVGLGRIGLFKLNFLRVAKSLTSKVVGRAIFGLPVALAFTGGEVAYYGIYAPNLDAGTLIFKGEDINQYCATLE